MRYATAFIIVALLAACASAVNPAGRSYDRKYNMIPRPQSAIADTARGPLPYRGSLNPNQRIP